MGAVNMTDGLWATRPPEGPAAGFAVGLTGPACEERPGPGRLRGSYTRVISQAGALFIRDDTRWDHALKVTGDGEGLVGQAGAVLLRKLSDQVDLTAALGSALARAGKFPLVDRASRW